MEFNFKNFYFILTTIFFIIVGLYIAYISNVVTEISFKLNEIETHNNFDNSFILSHLEKNKEYIQNMIDSMNSLYNNIEKNKEQIQNIATNVDNLHNDIIQMNNIDKQILDTIENLKKELQNLKNNQSIIKEKIEKYKIQNSENNIKPNKTNTNNNNYLGFFSITAYTSGPASCGIYSDGYTATGDKADWRNRIVAADWNILPPNTKIYIETMGTYTVKDRGSGVKGKSIDILMSDRKKALNFGRKNLKVWLFNPYLEDQQ